MGILLALKRRIAGGVELHPVSGDELFKASQKETKVYPIVARAETPAERSKAARTKEAMELEFSADEVFWMPDERLDSLAKAFERFRWEEKYNISFTGFVKAVINNRWNYVPPGMREPETTIPRRYKITGHHEAIGPLRVFSRKVKPAAPRVLVAVFVGLIVCITTVGFQYF